MDVKIQLAVFPECTWQGSGGASPSSPSPHSAMPRRGLLIADD
jgi:hypothetical protein